MNNFGMFGQMDDTSPVAAREDGFSPVRITAQRAAHVNLRNNEGTEIGTESNPLRVTPSSPTKTTYSASITALAPAASATDIFEIAGSATKTIKVTRLQISGTAAAAGAYDFVLLKRSTANSGGTSSAPAVVPHDANDAAGTAVVKAYTANPTLGTLVGNIRAAKGTVTTAAGAIPNVPTQFNFGEREGKEITLRGTAQVLALNLNAATMTGGSLNIDIEWTEE
jgi:hypothetical protein